ncbi:MAG: HD domain-containing protein [Actinobacteria bacterium]|nr:HD domain-containing protein [Actinomycetota bacterium]
MATERDQTDPDDESGTGAPDEVRVSTKFLRAAQWAADRHAEHAVGLPGTPSLAQVLGLASLVIEDGGTEREAIAAMIVDALGDEMPTAELRNRLGKKVTALVVATHPDRGTIAPGRLPLRADDWRTRAAAALERAATEADPSALRIRAAGVLQELRILQRELRRNGTIVYVRSPAPPLELLDHVRALAGTLARRRPRAATTAELRTTVTDVERLSEIENATIAWRVTHAGAA